jgi:hypothetical protein
MLRLARNMKNRTFMRVVRRTYVNDVALLQLPLVGNSMTNYLVDRTTIEKSDPWIPITSGRKATHVQTDLG